ncbi:MAG: AtpZ/AtpI family protein [Abditibacteriales bacterium]|nr:AtpZ/AtpI family protein [Abditibacteriales bacterium]MDW8364770.1 AtpZ/AtpI family protein [Abditibacteriales bacterium]
MWRGVRLMRNEGKKTSPGWLVMSGSGMWLVGSVVGGYALGAWLDGWLGTSFLMPVCMLLGAAAGFYQIFAMLFRIAHRK